MELGLGTVLVSGYILWMRVKRIWFLNSVGQWLYCVAESNMELGLRIFLLSGYIVCVDESNKELGFGKVLVSGYIVWLRVVRIFGLGPVLDSGFIVWLSVITNWVLEQ
jgi:hypothetical protein